LIALPLVAVRAAQDIDTLDPHITNRKDIGNVIPLVRNQHVSSFICIALGILLVLTGTWIYLWQLLGGANQPALGLGGPSRLLKKLRID